MLFARGDLEAVAGAVLVLMCGLVVVMLVVYVLFLLTLHKCLARCSPHSRTLEPGLVWLNLIPCFHFIWSFIIVNRVADSLAMEFRSRRLWHGGDFGRTLGISSVGIYTFTVFLNQITSAMTRKGNPEAGLFLSLVGLMISLVWLVTFIVYWVKIAGLSRELGDWRQSRDGYEDDDDDGYDDRYRRPNRRPPPGPAASGNPFDFQ